MATKRTSTKRGISPIDSLLGFQPPLIAPTTSNPRYIETGKDHFGNTRKAISSVTQFVATILKLTAIVPLAPVIVLMWLVYAVCRGDEVDHLDTKGPDTDAKEAQPDKYEPPQIGIL